jgi:hypothetical protein
MVDEGKNPIVTVGYRQQTITKKRQNAIASVSLI